MLCVRANARIGERMIKSLENVSIIDIHDALNDAFSTYEIKADLSIVQLNEMFKTRSFSAEYSRGFFENNVLIAFILIGFRDYHGCKYFYDIATGTRLSYQKKGISDSLLNEIKREMVDKNIDIFLLEVLEHNMAAQSLYKKNGFIISRKLNCFEYIFSDDGKNYSSEITIKESNKDTETNEVLCSFEPSWQNSNISYDNASNYNKLVVFKNNINIGYILVNIENGNILQFGLDQSCRNKYVLLEIFVILKSIVKANKIKLTNIEEGSEMDLLFKEISMNNFINQFEMKFIL